MQSGGLPPLPESGAPCEWPSWALYLQRPEAGRLGPPWPSATRRGRGSSGSRLPPCTGRADNTCRGSAWSRRRRRCGVPDWEAWLLPLRAGRTPSSPIDGCEAWEPKGEEPELMPTAETRHRPPQKLREPPTPGGGGRTHPHPPQHLPRHPGPRQREL